MGTVVYHLKTMLPSISQQEIEEYLKLNRQGRDNHKKKHQME